MKNKMLSAVAFSLLTASIFTFQNCARVSFVPGDSPNATTATGNDNVIAGTPGATPPPTAGTAPVAFACKKFVDITLVNGQIVDVPERTPEGLCFLAKIISTKVFDPSSSNPNSDSDVVSRNHDSSGPSSHHPYVLGAKSVHLFLEGQRSVLLSGGRSDRHKILVDNFILIGISPGQQGGDPNFYKAYGTADSAIQNTSSILFKAKEIPVVPFATGGTSSIAPLDLGQLDIHRDYELDVRALDAGSYGEVSDIYLVFK